LWLEGLDWDDELPPTSQVSWANFFKEMNELNHVMFERSLTPDYVIGVPSLIIFADASREAFGTCAYVRWETTNHVFVTSDLSRQNPE
jgi:hypothetical protein